MKVKRECLNLDKKALFADGYDDCIIGTVSSFGRPDVVIYDKNKMIKKLAKDMPVEAAEEFFNFNILGSFVGEYTPAFAVLLKSRTS